MHPPTHPPTPIHPHPHAGQLILEGGGFCGQRTAPVSLDLSAFDGVSMRVRGDGQTYKLNIKTVRGSGV